MSSLSTIGASGSGPVFNEVTSSPNNATDDNILTIHRLHSEIKELHEKNVSWQNYSAQQENYVRRMLEQHQQQLAAIQQENIQLRSDLSASEHERLALVAQLQTNKEDFDQERRDRERAQSRLNDKETELVILRRQLHEYDLRQMQNLADRRQAALDYHRAEYVRTHPFGPLGDDLATDGDDEIDSGLDAITTSTNRPSTTNDMPLSVVREGKEYWSGNRAECRRGRESGVEDDNTATGGDDGREEEEEINQEGGTYECQDCYKKFNVTAYLEHVQTNCSM